LISVTGTLPRLLARCPDGALDAVVITHEHPDHCIDLGRASENSRTVTCSRRRKLDTGPPRPVLADLMLTHFWPGNDRAAAATAARAAFGGVVLVADDDLVVPFDRA
jgi:ribonuclease BN (tRNA processing enzyme)